MCLTKFFSAFCKANHKSVFLLLKEDFFCTSNHKSVFLDFSRKESSLRTLAAVGLNKTKRDFLNCNKREFISLLIMNDTKKICIIYCRMRGLGNVT